MASPSPESASESLDFPALWPDGSGILYQRSNLRAGLSVPGQPYIQYPSRVEHIPRDGATPTVLLDDAQYPGPAPDGAHFAFVRSVEHGTAMFVHSVPDGTDAELVASGQFLTLAYPRFSPDGQRVAFTAISVLSPIGRGPGGPFAGWLGIRSAEAHGFPWETWLVNADGSGLRQIPDVLDDDPSVAWSPDGTRLIVYGGWGSFVVDAASGDSTPLPYLTGYGSVGWLAD